MEGNEWTDKVVKEGGQRNQSEANIDMGSAFWQFTLQSWHKEFVKMAQGKPNGTTNWHLRCCNGQLSSRIPPGVPWQAQRAIHQLRLNRLTSTASYHVFVGLITSPICPHSGTGEETAEHLLFFCPKHQHYFGDSIYITYVFQDCDAPKQ